MVSLRLSALAAVTAVSLAGGAAFAAGPELSVFARAVAEAAASDRDVAEFYQARGYDDLWTGTDAGDRARREAFLRAGSMAADQGLPAGRYAPEVILDLLRDIPDDRARGRAEVAMSRLFLRYARDMQTGVLTPSRVVADIKREVPLRDRGALLAGVAGAAPAAFFRALPPQSAEFVRLLRAKLELESVLDDGGWGPAVPGQKIRPGDRGASVVALAQPADPDGLCRSHRGRGL